MDNNQQVINPLPPIQNQEIKRHISNQKGHFLLIMGIIVIIAVFGIGGYFLLQMNEGKVTPLINTQNSSNQTTPKNQNVSFQTIALATTNLNDRETELYFADANKVYKMRLDGSSAEEIASFPHNVGSVKVLKNGKILVSTGNSKYEKVANKGPQDPDYREISSEYHYYIIKDSTKEEIDSTKYKALFDLESLTGEKIYTKELTNGQAEILLDKFDGTAPTRIGLLKEKLIALGCEIDPCPEKTHPGEFYPSFDGSYLLNNPPGGGGLGQSGIVVSRDGSKVYKIDFYWFVSSAVWTGNNTLLTKSQDGKQKLFTFKEDGTFNELPFEPELEGYFSQVGLSPTKQHVLINRSNPVGIALFDLINRKLITVEKEEREKLIQQYNFQDELQIDPRIDHLFGFLGWNKKGNKLAYSEQISPFANTEIDNPTEIREIKIYDLSSGEIYTVVKLNPHPKNTDEYLLQGKPVSDVGKFAVK